MSKYFLTGRKTSINSSAKNYSRGLGGISYIQRPYRMASCDQGDWFKSRMKNFEGAPPGAEPIIGKLHDYNEVSLYCKCLNPGTIDVYLGGPDDNDPVVRITEDRLYLGSITFTADMVGEQKSWRIRNIAIPLNTESYCYYLEFPDGNDICEIYDLMFYAVENPQTWSLTEEGIPLMHERVLTWRNVFHGIHTILGWGSNTTGWRDRQIYDDFFVNWVGFNYPIYESYFGAVQDELFGTSEGRIPAIACAAEQYNKPWYHYFCETWWSATDELAQPTERCVIMWDIPDFGWWWEPQYY